MVYKLTDSRNIYLHVLIGLFCDYMLIISIFFYNGSEKLSRIMWFSLIGGLLSYRGIKYRFVEFDKDNMYFKSLLRVRHNLPLENPLYISALGGRTGTSYFFEVIYKSKSEKRKWIMTDISLSIFTYEYKELLKFLREKNPTLFEKLNNLPSSPRLPHR